MRFEVTSECGCGVIFCNRRLIGGRFESGLPILIEYYSESGKSEIFISETRRVRAVGGRVIFASDSALVEFFESGGDVLVSQEEWQTENGTHMISSFLGEVSTVIETTTAFHSFCGVEFLGCEIISAVNMDLIFLNLKSEVAVLKFEAEDYLEVLRLPCTSFVVDKKRKVLSVKFACETCGGLNLYGEFPFSQLSVERGGTDGFAYGNSSGGNGGLQSYGSGGNGSWQSYGSGENSGLQSYGSGGFSSCGDDFFSKSGGWKFSRAVERRSGNCSRLTFAVYFFELMQYSKLCTKQLFIPYLDCELSKSPQDIVEFIGDFQKIIPTADCGVILVYAQANGGWITRKFTLELEEVDGEKQSDGGEKQSCGIEKQSGGIEKQSGGIEKQSCGIEKQSGNIKKQSGGGEKFVVANILEEEEFDFD